MRKSALRVLAWIAVVVAVGWFWARLGEPLGVDQGLFACFTRWVPRGWLPYRDLFDSKPPLFLYWWGAARVVPGPLPQAVWWAEGVWLAATVALGHRLVRDCFGRTAALFASMLLVLGLWAPALGGFWSRAQAEELLVLPAFGAVALARRPSARSAVGAGVLVGVCGLFKIPSMALGGAVAVLGLVRHDRAQAPRRLAGLALGVVVPWALAAAWFAAHGAFRAFVDGVFVYHRHNAAFIAPPWGVVLEGFLRTEVDALALHLVLAAVGLFVLVRRRAKDGLWVAAWIALAALAVVLQRQLAGYHFLLTVPPLSVAGGLGAAIVVRAVRRTGRVRAFGLVSAVAALGLLARAALDVHAAYRPGLDLALGRLDRPRYLLAIQQGSYSNLTEEEAARFVAERTPKDAGVFVFGLSPGIYALADRHPTTRYPFHKILFTEAPLSIAIPGLEGRRAELLARLERDPPAYVLVGRGDQNGFEPLDSVRSLARFPALAAWLGERYAFTTQIGRFLVYARRR